MLAPMNKPNLLQRIGRGLTRTRNFVMNGLFLLVLVLIVVAVFDSAGGVSVPDDAALVLDPEGALVEETRIGNPLENWWSPGQSEPSANVNDLVRAVDLAAEDDRIRALVLDLDKLTWAASAHARYLGDALERFKSAGKEVLAFGYDYGQPHYAIASFADAVYLHPHGGMAFTGYGYVRAYFKGLLDKLGVNIHVFRVGKYKEAVEPFTEEGMSTEVREVNQAMVDELWGAYRQLVVANRGIEPEVFDRYAVTYDEVLANTGGNMARVALEHGLVDELSTPDQVRNRVAAATGQTDGDDYADIDYRSYLSTLPPDLPADGNVGLIFAQGPILMGDDRAAAAADNLVGLIREAREDESVAALVLRIDSPGGHAFASELIRQELELTQLADKPVVASMGPVAASGGYWIAATADRIVAHPTTITGSIGIFGLVATFEEALAGVGVQGDGVGSLPLSGGFDPLRGLNEPAQRVLQASIRHGYDNFVNLVAKGRDMPPEAVEEIAQGRVWLGSQAAEIGLVDELGALPNALDAAAALADLDVEDYGVKTFSPPVPPFDLLMQEILDSAASVGAGSRPPSVPSRLRQAWEMLQQLQNPAAAYALCEVCLGIDQRF